MNASFILPDACNYIFFIAFFLAIAGDSLAAGLTLNIKAGTGFETKFQWEKI